MSKGKQYGRHDFLKSPFMTFSATELAIRQRL